MPNTITLELSPHQVEKLVEKLPMEEKINLVNKLERETLHERWNKLLRIIDARLKKYPISQKEINREIELARKLHYAKRSR